MNQEYQSEKTTCDFKETGDFLRQVIVFVDDTYNFSINVRLPFIRN